MNVKCKKAESTIAYLQFCRKWCHFVKKYSNNNSCVAVIFSIDYFYLTSLKMDFFTTQTGTLAAYGKVMTAISPALCSLVCVLFVAMLSVEYRNSAERWLRLAVMIFFFIVCVLWFAMSVLSGRLSDLRNLRIAQSAVAFGAPAAVLILIAGRSRGLVVAAAVAGAMLVCSLFLAAVRGLETLWDTTAMVAIPLGQVWLTHHMIRRQHLGHSKFTLRPTTTKGKNPTTGEIPPAEELTERSLEEYFKQKRPYLDPAFRLSDLAEGMDVNCAEISVFVNRTFGINFKRYVNRWRLAEYERLMSLPSNELKNPYKIIPMAGFTDARHYRRVVEQEMKQESEYENEKENEKELATIPE